MSYWSSKKLDTRAHIHTRDKTLYFVLPSNLNWKKAAVQKVLLDVQQLLWFCWAQYHVTSAAFGFRKTRTLIALFCLHKTSLTHNSFYPVADWFDFVVNCHLFWQCFTVSEPMFYERTLNKVVSYQSWLFRMGSVLTHSSRSSIQQEFTSLTGFN